MKRGRKDPLTGGTGDVSPQLLTYRAAESGNDATTTTETTLPITRLATEQTPTIIEILKVYFSMASNWVETDNDIECYIGTKNFGTTQIAFNESSVFAGWNRSVRITTSGSWVVTDPYVLDLTDGAGHGFLVATDKLYTQVSSAAYGAVAQVDIKILYRFKRVSVLEYVGIVQGQQ